MPRLRALWAFSQGGPLTRTFTVDVAGDTAVEADETFTVVLTDPSAGAVLLDPSGQGTILDGTADLGVATADVMTNTVTWNGALAPAETATTSLKPALSGRRAALLAAPALAQRW